MKQPKKAVKKTNKAKHLKLKPSARDKRRYFLIKGVNNKDVERAILEYIGVLGFAKAAYKEVKEKSVTQKHKNAIIGSCARKELVNVTAALTMAGIHVEKTAHTIKSLLK